MKKQKFSYHFTPAGITSNFVPLIVILYGKDDSNLEDFEYKMWNVLQICSLDSEESELLKELIIDISETYECEEYIFMYGNIKSVKEEVFKGIVAECNVVKADLSEITQKQNIKNVLDEFEKMVPDL
ncbi:hypothetical protein JHD49_03650 [Sulfurimonas sp. SAG-AH-194-C21]|nr:hypothetical protein [Sulfurimonas sp. SAG-AH-194-C21]MDF1883025.1 hypothetical protein [Sulfurimonas sp. SAG-AH-194-C21]